MVKKEEYKLSVENKKEVTFVDSVVKTAQATVDVAVAVGSARGADYKAKANELKGNLSKVVDGYKGNVVALEETRVSLQEAREQVAEYHTTAGRLRERVKSEVVKVSSLEAKLDESTNSVSALKSSLSTAISEYNAVVSKYIAEEKERETYETQLKSTKAALAERNRDLNSTKGDLSVALSRVDGLSSRATTRTSALQSFLQTYFGVPESTFKGVAENKREDFVYKLLEEQLTERAAKDKKVEEELNEALGVSVKEEKPQNGVKADKSVVNRIKTVTPAGK